jgi:hypothetical protein
MIPLGSLRGGVDLKQRLPALIARTYELANESIQRHAAIHRYHGFIADIDFKSVLQIVKYNRLLQRYSLDTDSSSTDRKALSNILVYPSAA